MDEFGAEVMRAYDLLALYTEIRSRDAQAIRARASRPQSVLDESLVLLLRSPQQEDFRRKYHEWCRLTADEVDLLMSFSVLLNFVKRAVSSTRLDFGFDELMGWFTIDGQKRTLPMPGPELIPKPMAGWDCPDLLSSIYMQFYLYLVTDNMPLRICENPACRMSFPVTRKGKRFCNATCRSNARHYR